MISQPRRRWACFPGSIVSDFENRPALLYRAMAERIASIGDEARFYEERGNPWLRNLLTQRGASGFLRFQDDFPAVDYVTFDVRTGADLADWLTRVLATVDIVLVDPVVPRDIVRWIGELTRPQLHTFLVDSGERHPSIVDGLQNVEMYSGICASGPGQSALVQRARSEQIIVEFGPSHAAPLANGDADRHLRHTAELLVDRIAEVVDNSLRAKLANGQGDSSLS